MKQSNYLLSALLGAGLLIANSASAQWTHAGTSTTLDNLGDNVGIGTAAPAFKLDIQNAGIATMSFKSATDNASILLDRGASNKTSSLTYRSGGNNLWQTGIVTSDNYTIRNNGLASVAMYFSYANNFVGVGNNAPTERLDVTGNIRSSGNMVAVGTVTAAGGNSGNWNTAYSWGNHAAAGYLTVETDPQVGVNTLNYAPVFNGTSLVTSNIYSSGTFAGVNATAPLGLAQFVVGSTNTGYYGMYVNSTGAAGARKPFYGYGVGGASNCWTYYDEATKTLRFYNVGDRMAIDSLGQIGIGTNSPGYYLDIQAAAGYRALNAVSNYVGNVGQIVNIQRTSAPFSNNDLLAITAPAGSPDDFQFIEADIANSNRFQVNGDGSVGVGGTVNSSARLNVDGTNVANKKLYGAVITADSLSSSSYGLYVQQNASGNSHVKAIVAEANPSIGWGYGVYSTGGYRGVYGIGDGGTSTGTCAGVQGSASGSGGIRYGVYGSASGGTENWGGYFPTKTYTAELRVGTTNGATGYIVSVGGKLIAEEVRIELEASWPDYVFNNDYKLLSIDEVEQHIRQFNHLPGVPSADEVDCNGLMVGEMQNITMKKVEELTLYMIQLKKENDDLKKRITNLENK